MSGRVILDHLPRIPAKDQGITERVRKTADELKVMLQADPGSVNLYQRGWLAEYDEVHGTGDLKGTLFEEITRTTTTETQRKVLELQGKPSPQAEKEHYEGQRLDRVLGVISEVQRESTRTVRTVLEEIKEEREAMRLEREENKQFVRQLFMDQRSLLEIAFVQVTKANENSLEAMETLKEGIRAKGEAEAIGIGVQAQANAAQQQQDGVKNSIKGKLEDTLLLGIANKMGLEIQSPPKPATQTAQPVK